MRARDVTIRDFLGMICVAPLLFLRLGLIASGLHDRRNWYR